MDIRRQIDELVASPAFSDAVRGAGLRDVKITIHNPDDGGVAYVTGVNADGLSFDLEMVMSGFFQEADPARAVVEAVLYDLRFVPPPGP